MQFKKLEYSDRETVAPKLRMKNSYLSEYSFTNAYLFRKPHDYEVAISGSCTFLKGLTYDKKSYLMPVCPIEIIPLEKLIDEGKHVDFFFPIEEEWLEFFPERYFSYSYLDGDSDYVYLTERLATMAGRKLSKKRNLLKQYNESYEKVDKELNLDIIGDAVKVLDIWVSEISDGGKADYDECKEALEKMDELNLTGMMFYADGKPSGFTLGEEINDETYALHFAKGCREYKGVYQYMYNTFNKLLANKYKYINFEQDLGKDTLKQSKSTYYPDEMRLKYRVALKK